MIRILTNFIPYADHLIFQTVIDMPMEKTSSLQLPSSNLLNRLLFLGYFILAPSLFPGF